MFGPGSPALENIHAQVIAEKATRDPTDRSIPAVMMTNVMPMARKAVSATCLEMITRLPSEMKLGAMMQK